MIRKPYAGAVAVHGWLLFSFGVISIISWLGGWYRLLTVYPEFAPTQFNSAMCFAFLGAYFIFKARELFNTAQLALLFFTLFLSSAALLEASFGLPSWSGQIFYNPTLLTATSEPGLMAPNTAIALLLATLTLLTSRFTDKRSTIFPALSMGGVVIFALGVAALVGYSLEVEIAYGWGLATRMSIAESVAALFLGVATTFAAWGRFVPKSLDRYEIWKAITIYAATTVLVTAVVSSAFTGFPIYQALKDETKQRVTEKTVGRASIVAEILSGEPADTLVDVSKPEFAQPIGKVLSLAAEPGTEFLLLDTSFGRRRFFSPDFHTRTLIPYTPKLPELAQIPTRRVGNSASIMTSSLASAVPTYVSYANVEGHPFEIIGLTQIERLRSALNNRVLKFLGISLVLTVLSSIGVFVLVQQLVSFAEDSQKQIDDIRRSRERETREALEEKEVLLAEVHHRVKNNLQVISSLLRLQARSIENEEVAEIFQDIRNRVRAIALLHQLLYETKNFSAVRFDTFLHELCSKLFSAQGKSDQVSYTIESPEIFLKLEQSVPCGLLINELVTNSLKHAFPSGAKGVVSIRAGYKDESSFFLSVSDNGVGLSETSTHPKRKSLGLRLVEQLSAQLGGEIMRDPSNGVTTEVVFDRNFVRDVD